MNSKEILLRAARRIEKEGLSIGKAYTGKSPCAGAAIIGAAYNYQEGTSGNPRFYANEYMKARNAFCGLVGIASSYDAIADWNDESWNDKTGKKHYKRTKEEVVKQLRIAADISAEEIKKEKK